MLIALASTAAVVLSDDPQTLRLAVVGALWAFVLAAFAAPRRREAARGRHPGHELELRRTYEIELEKEVAARREYELQLEVYLRRELERGLAEDVAALRDEVGRMRGEMIDRLDGELRMERIETTRLIGGSLRALQDEARRLGIGVPLPAELAQPLDADYPPVGYPAAIDQPAPTYSTPDRPPTGFSGAGGYPAPGGSTAAGTRHHRCSTSRHRTGGPRATPRTPLRARAGAAVPAGRPGARHQRRPRRRAPDPPRAPARHQPRPRRSRRQHRRHPGTRRPPPVPPAPRPPAAGESVAPRRRRAREDGEDNEVMSRLLGR